MQQFQESFELRSCAVVDWQPRILHLRGSELGAARLPQLHTLGSRLKCQLYGGAGAINLSGAKQRKLFNLVGTAEPLEGEHKFIMLQHRPRSSATASCAEQAVSGLSLIVWAEGGGRKVCIKCLAASGQQSPLQIVCLDYAAWLQMQQACVPGLHAADLPGRSAAVRRQVHAWRTQIWHTVLAILEAVSCCTQM